MPMIVMIRTTATNGTQTTIARPRPSTGSGSRPIASAARVE